MSTLGPESGVGSADAADIEAHIEATRTDLAETIDALGARLDVRTRVQERLARLRDEVTDLDGRPTPRAVAAGAGLVAVVATGAALVVWRRSR